MKTKTMYVADDGTPFNSMQECIVYEKSMNKYVVSFLKETGEVLKQQDFGSEAEAKRFIANILHRCFEDNFISLIRLIHCGKTVEFNSTELSKFVPAHYKINGEKLNEIFQMCATKNMVIPGYTLHGDYYLADEIIPNVTLKEACGIKEVVTLPNGKTVIAHTLSKEELETIPREERKISENEHYWYWTSTPYDGNDAWFVYCLGDFYYDNITYSDDTGGARLGFKNPF